MTARHPSPLARSLRTEAQGALATTVARLLLIGSVVMALISGAANLSVLDSLIGEETIRLALHSATVPALVFALVAGAYAASTDRRFGFIDQRLLSDPSRIRWLGGKAIVQAVVGLGYGLLGAAAAVVTSITVFAAKNEAMFDLTSTVVVRSLLGVLLATTMLAALGAAIGSMSGNTSAIVGGVLVWTLVIEPPTVLGLPEFGRWLPSAAGLALTYSPNADLLDQVKGGLVLAGYTILALWLAGHRIRRADI